MGNSVLNLQQEHIRPLFWRYALPAIIGTSITAVYNIIDGVFVGHWIGNDALAGLGIVMPIMSITAAVGLLVGAGASSRVSIALGKNDVVLAEKLIGVALVLSLALSGSVLLAIYLLLKPILLFSGASAQTFPYAYDFLVVFLPGHLALSLCFSFNNIMRALGYPVKAMVTMLTTVVANIIFAPLFIKVCDWGIKGAAAATVLAMVLGCAFVMFHFFSPRSNVRMRWNNVFVRPDWSIIRSILSIGLSPFAMQISTSIVVFLIISQLNFYGGEEGTTAVGAYTIANRLIMLVVMIVIGLTQGMQPIVGYNYGARQWSRVRATLNYTIAVSMIITSVGMALCHLLPHQVVALFGATGLLAQESEEALRYLTAAFPLVGFQMVVSSFFQSIGHAKQAVFLSLSRQVILLIPLVLIIPYWWGLKGVWLAGPVSDFMSAFIVLLFYIHQLRKISSLSKKNNIH